jgi:cell division protein FtsQ
MNKKLKKFIFKVILFLFIVAVLTGFSLNSAYFNIKDIEIAGNNRLKSEYIENISGISIGENIFRINIGNSEESIRQNEYIEYVKITRKFPSKVIINVKERQNEAVLKSNNQIINIDKNGYVLKISEYNPSTKLEAPLLVGVNFADVSLGKKLNFKNGQVFKSSSILLDLLKKYNCFTQIGEVNMANMNKIVLKDYTDRKIYLYNMNNMEYKIAFLYAIFKNPKSHHSGVIDFANPRRPVLKIGEN